MRLVMGKGMIWTGIGLLVGTVSALGLARSLRSLLFAVSPADPITLVGVALSLTTVTMIACYLPARRAVRVGAWDALRSD
jgi:putative ABC transport system permease protein